MAAATAPAPSPTSGISIILSGKWLYALLLTLIAASVIGTFVFAFIPNFLGLGALAGSIVALFAYLTHDLTDDTAAPGWLTFVIIAVAGGLMMAAGYFSGNPTLTWTSGLAAALVFFSFLYHAVAADAGASINANAEAFLTAGFGGIVAVIQWIQANPNYTTATLIVTVVTTLVTFFHVSEEDGIVSIAPNPGAPGPA